MTEAFVDGVKHTIRNLMYCAKVLKDSKPLEAFSKGFLMCNFYSQHCKESHDSK